MSIYNSQEYNDAWDDMSSSLQEQLLQDVAQLESAALTPTPTPKITTTTTTAAAAMDQSLSSQNTRYNKKQKRHHDKSGQFFVYKDPSLTLSPISEAEKMTSLKPTLQLLDRTNQQHIQQYDNGEKKRYSPPPTCLQNESVNNNDNDIDIIDDDDMWLEFDDMDIPALLDDIENSNKNITTTVRHDQTPVNDNENEAVVITAPSLARLDNSLHKFGGFQTAGSKKDIKPNDNALKAAHDKALALFAEPITLSPEATAAPISESSMKTKSSILSPRSPPELTIKQDRLQHSTSGDSIPTFTPVFSTARGTRLNEPSLEAKRKAQQILLASPTRSSSPLVTMKSPLHNGDKSHDVLDTPNITTGFSKANGVNLEEPTLDAKLKAHQLLQTQSISLTSPISTDTLNKDSLQHLSTPTSSGNSSYQYEDILQLYGGFSKASGKEVDTTISEAAKQQALALFTSDTSSTQLTQPSSQGRTTDIGLSQQDNDGDDSSADRTSLLNSTSTLQDTSSPSSVLDQPQHTVVDQGSLSSPQQGKVSSGNSSLSVSQSPPPVTAITKPTSAHRRRTHNQRPRSKPFKSPAVNLDLVKAGLEKRVSATASIRMKGPSVFAMYPIGCRRPLSSLGHPRKYTEGTLASMNIPVDVIGLTPCKARSYKFTNNWSIQDAEKELLAAGATSPMLPKGWIENHYGWVVWKLAKRLCMFPHYIKTDGDNDPGQWWSPEYVMNQLLYRYEREINLGQRSVIRRIMEQDDVPGKQMVLMVADIICISSSVIKGRFSSLNSNNNDDRKYRLQLTDGWYQISAFVDPKMDSMISQGQVFVGQKLSITGAQLTGDSTPKTPLEALSMAKIDPSTSQQHDITSTTLIISSNSCLPCSWHSTLGYPRRRFRRHVIRRLDTNIYENGGLITMMEVVICKKYPMMYTETLKNGMTVKRTSKDEEDYRRTLDLQQHQTRTSFSSISSNSGILKSQDRRVSGYFRLRVCDIHNRASDEHRSPIVATLLVANTTEIMHMDLLEGQHYRLFFVKPYQPRNKLLEGPNLITTQLTKWEPLSSSKQQPQPIKDSPYPLRSICLCADIKDLTMADVDMAVLVLHTQSPTTQQFIDGRKAWHSTLLVTDSSLALCQITYRTFYRPVQDMNGQILGLMNVRFVLHDSKCDIIHIKSSDESEFWTHPAGTMGFMQHAMKELKQWMESESCGLATVKRRVKDLTQ